MTAVTMRKRLAVTLRQNAITRDGISVPIIADGPGVGRFEHWRAERNRRRWNAGLRPNRLGIWR